MNNLIKRFNEIQEINKELKIEAMKLPEIVVIGSQSSGKSSVLESIVGNDIFPKGKGMITRCPLRLELLNGRVDGAEFNAIFNHRNAPLTSFIEISREIKKETDKRTSNAKSITEDEIVLEITGPQFPTLTLVDLPGLIQNIENDQPKDLEYRIKELMRKYIESDNSIILAISPANVDLATSEIVKYAKEVDIQGRRTIHVLTKLDIMNEGENAQDPLNCDYLSPSIAIIGVVNRNERDVQRSLSLEEQRSKENKFFFEKYPDLAAKHGTMYLLKTLERVLTQAIQKFIPIFEQNVKDNIRKYEKELECLDPAEKRVIVSNSMVDFCNTYKRTLKGNLDTYQEKLEGGALISICLYETFLGHMHQVIVSHLTEEKIYFTVKNAAGVRDIAFSFEKPFKQLIRTEMEKFREPCKDCIQEIEEKLCEFVDFVLDKLGLFDYPKVAEAMKNIALQIIAKRSERCRSMIKDYITSEIKDVTFTNPFRDILNNIKNYPAVSLHENNVIENTTIAPSMIKSIINLVGLSLPISSYYPHLTMAVVAFGLASKVKEAYDAQKFNEIINTINDVLDQGIGLETLKKAINDDLAVNMEQFMLGFKTSVKIEDDNENKKKIQQTQVIIIKNVLSLYFEMVRKNIINYVPKTIQTFLINRISDEMLRKVQIDLMKEKYLDNLICDESDSTRIENLKNDLEKSLIMKEKLKRLKGIII